MLWKSPFLAISEKILSVFIVIYANYSPFFSLQVFVIARRENACPSGPFLGRNGGIINQNKKIFRVAQSFGFNSYGEKINVVKKIFFKKKRLEVINLTVEEMFKQGNLII